MWSRLGQSREVKPKKKKKTHVVSARTKQGGETKKKKKTHVVPAGTK
jgi:hypothetical protein